jgi:phenylpyruvate tautomerase PptA (4-oxalocrotonate tautomerase family)
MLINISFFAADDESEEKKDLVERIEAKWRKFVAVSEPTPIILESMRQEEKTLGDEVKVYLESLNE